jgi:hypothetical protein
MEWGLAVYCPSCGAQPKEHCHNTLGQTTKVHLARVNVMMSKRESFLVPNTLCCISCGVICDARMEHRCKHRSHDTVVTGSYGEVHINGERYSERQQHGSIKSNPTGGIDG